MNFQISPLRIVLPLMFSFLTLPLSVSSHAQTPDPNSDELSAAESNALRWPVENAWDEEYERMYSQFVVRISEGRNGPYLCSPVHTCFSNPAVNPYRSASVARPGPGVDHHQVWEADPPRLMIRSDCADLPYAIRSYFAWKHRLPFGFVNVVGGDGTDLRYNSGNHIVSRYNLPPTLPDALMRFSSDVNTAMYRFHPDMDVDPRDPTLFPDFYPIPIDQPQSIIPGAVIYSPSGHVGVVTAVDRRRGKIHYMDAHPDNTLTRKIYDIEFYRSFPAAGHGFKKWRPVQMVNGQLIGTPNAQIPDYDRHQVQFYGTERSPRGWQYGTFSINGTRIPEPRNKTEILGGYAYYEYLRQSLTNGHLIIDPVDDFRDLVTELCNSLRERVTAVNEALTAGLDRQTLPRGRLPRNIYGTNGDWETYSSPSRDARFKTAYKNLLDQATNYIEAVETSNTRLIRYSGGTGPQAAAQLARDLLRLYIEADRACTASYTASNGESRPLTLDGVRVRLFKLSFDPYHCVEKRWGETEGTPEYRTCHDDAHEEEWYQAQQYLRNQITQNYSSETRMDFDLRRILRTPPLESIDANPPRSMGDWRNGVRTPPNVDVVSYLAGKTGDRSEPNH